MNLLLTNTHEEQAYLILRCLRRTFDRVVITVPEGGFLHRWSGSCALSRYVHRRHAVPDCSADWATGQLQPDNTPAEAAWMDRIEDICIREDISVVLPSYDAEVYVLSKNLERLQRRGILVPVAPFERLMAILDKSRTLAAAARCGFPAPATRTPESEEELETAAMELPAPWVLKPRCNAHGARLSYATDRDALFAAWRELSAVSPRPLVQEFIPPASKRNFYVLADRGHEIVSVLSPEVHRLRRAGLRTPSAAVESTREVPLRESVANLVRELGVWGCMTIQTVVDARDGSLRLMEANPRFGHNLWYRTELGVNEPELLLAIARGETPPPVPPVQEGVLMADPLWDLIHLVGQCVDRSGDWIRSRLGRERRHAAELDFDTVGFLLSAYRDNYFSRRPRITNPLNRGLLRDPLPPLVRMGRIGLQTLQRRVG